MRKLLILVLVSITAFLGVNLTKVSTYAATSSGVTYVTEGNRVYIHFPSVVKNPEDIDYSLIHGYELDIEYFLYYQPYQDYVTNDPEGMLRIFFEAPENATGIVVEKTSSGLEEDFASITPEYYGFDLSNHSNQFLLAFDPNGFNTGDKWLIAQNENQVEIYVPFAEIARIYFTIETSEPAELPYWNFVDGYFILDYNAVGEELDVEVLVDVYPNPTFYNNVNDVLVISPVNNQIRVKYTQIDDMMGTPIYGYQVYSGFEWLTLSELKYQVDNLEPIITGSTLIVSLDNPLPEATLRAEISAWDDLDGDITADLVYEGGTYESARLAGTLVVGNTYTMIYSVEDSSGNITQATINVEVVDITKPVFGISNTTTEISYTQTLNLESFKANLLATDNYDDTEDLVINILTDNYTANKLVPGTYSVVYRAIDTSTNYRDITITVEVIDNVGPVITGPNNFNVPLSPKTNISVILQQFTASDAIDGNVTTSIEVLSDAYTAASTPGIYSVTIRFSDSSGNTTNKTFTITMADGVPPILFITSGLLIGVNELQTLTVEQIITLLEAQGNITGFTVLSNTYAGNENTPGTYQMVVAYTQNEVQYQHTLSILVTPSQLLQWTVSFITNGGSNLASVIVNDFGQLLIQAPSRTGYRFVGWYKDAELTQSFSMVTGRITEDTTLYAKWVPNATGVPSVIIDNISNLKLVDVVLIVGTIAVSIGIGFAVANKKKPTSKRKRG